MVVGICGDSPPPPPKDFATKIFLFKKNCKILKTHQINL
jgi:hypothetical protein